MNKEEIIKKRVMHIDTSTKLSEKGNTGVAYKIVETNEHKGFALNNNLKRNLDSSLSAQEDYARIYAICIYQLIKNNLNDFDILVICEDENIVYVKIYLDMLFSENQEYQKKEIISIGELRLITGNKSLSSYAHGVANAYRKKALNRRKWTIGIPLNVVEISYKIILTKWNEIQEAMGKHKVESDLSNHLPA